MNPNEILTKLKARFYLIKIANLLLFFALPISSLFLIYVCFKNIPHIFVVPVFSLITIISISLYQKLKNLLPDNSNSYAASFLDKKLLTKERFVSLITVDKEETSKILAQQLNKIIIKQDLEECFKFKIFKPALYSIMLAVLCFTLGCVFSKTTEELQTIHLHSIEEGKKYSKELRKYLEQHPEIEKKLKDKVEKLINTLEKKGLYNDQTLEQVEDALRKIQPTPTPTPTPTPVPSKTENQEKKNEVGLGENEKNEKEQSGSSKGQSEKQSSEGEQKEEQKNSSGKQDQDKSDENSQGNDSSDNKKKDSEQKKGENSKQNSENKKKDQQGSKEDSKKQENKSEQGEKKENKQSGEKSDQNSQKQKGSKQNSGQNKENSKQQKDGKPDHKKQGDLGQKLEEIKNKIKNPNKNEKQKSKQNSDKQDKSNKESDQQSSQSKEKTDAKNPKPPKSGNSKKPQEMPTGQDPSKEGNNDPISISKAKKEKINLPKDDEKIQINELGSKDPEKEDSKGPSTSKVKIETQEFKKPKAELNKTNQPIPLEYEDIIR